MKFFKISGLIIAAAALSAGVKLLEEHVRQNANSQVIQTEKDPNITAAEQLSFVLCKKRDGGFTNSHLQDMHYVLKRYGINRSILEKQKVKAMAQEFIDNGSCEFYASYKRIGDMIPEEGEGELKFKSLNGWKREYIKILAEGECRTRTGKLDVRGRESFLVKRLEKIDIPENIGQDDAERVVKENLSAIVWLAAQKVKFKDCEWMNG